MECDLRTAIAFTAYLIVAGGKSCTCSLEASTGHQIVELKIGLFADALTKPENAQWKAFTKRMLFVTRSRQDPLDHLVERLASLVAARIEKTPNAKRRQRDLSSRLC